MIADLATTLKNIANWLCHAHMESLAVRDYPGKKRNCPLFASILATVTPLARMDRQVASPRHRRAGGEDPPPVSKAVPANLAQTTQPRPQGTSGCCCFTLAPYGSNPYQTYAQTRLRRLADDLLRTTGGAGAAHEDGDHVNAISDLVKAMWA